MNPALPPFAALVPLVVYPLFCSSPQVIVGPDIAICLLIVSAVGPLAGNDGVLAAELASVLAVLSGVLLLLASAPVLKLHTGVDFGISSLSGTPSGKGEQVLARSFGAGTAVKRRLIRAVSSAALNWATWATATPAAALASE